MESLYQWGRILLKLKTDGNSLTAVSFCSNAESDFKASKSSEKSPALDLAKKWLDIYFSGKEPDFLPPLTLKGTDFQMRVWQKLRKIPYGKTTTYGEIAEQIAAETGKAKMSAQAVGGAVGKNPIAIIIPCHRVIGKDGSLTGFAGGVEVKMELLVLEKASFRE